MIDANGESTREQRVRQWMQDYGNILQRICFLYLSDASLAEDAVQETFFKAWKSIDQFEGRNGSSEKTWLTRIAINICKDYCTCMYLFLLNLMARDENDAEWNFRCFMYLFFNSSFFDDSMCLAAWHAKSALRIALQKMSSIKRQLCLCFLDIQSNISQMKN